jgi:hypothetical protein
MILAECAEEDEDEEEAGSLGNGFAARFHDMFIPVALKAVKVLCCHQWNIRFIVQPISIPYQIPLINEMRR